MEHSSAIKRSKLLITCSNMDEPQEITLRQGNLMQIALYCMTLFIWSKVKSLSHVQPFATPWTVAYQALPSMGFSRQEYWSGLPFPSPGDLSNPGIKPGSPALQTDALPSEQPGKPRPEYWSWKALPFFRGSSQSRDQTQVSHIAGGFFTNWATREPHGCESWTIKKAEHHRIDAFEL